jgi:hypothetical protein
MPLQPLPIRRLSVPHQGIAKNGPLRLTASRAPRPAAEVCGTDHDRTGGRHERRREPERPGGASLEPRADRGIRLASFYGNGQKREEKADRGR